MTIITEVFGHSPVWHSHSLRFMSSSGLHKPLQALPLTLGCFKSRSNPALMTTTVHRDQIEITLTLDPVQLKKKKNSDSNNYLTRLIPMKQTIKLQNHNCKSVRDVLQREM